MEGRSASQVLNHAQAREEAWKSLASELRRGRDHWKREADRFRQEALECVAQTMERDQFIDMMAENLGLSVNERFLYDRHTQSIMKEHARFNEQAEKSKRALRDASQAVSRAMGNAAARGVPVSDEELRAIMGEIQEVVDAERG
jgi:hypothetical protein